MALTEDELLSLITDLRVIKDLSKNYSKDLGDANVRLLKIFNEACTILDTIKNDK